MPGQASGHGHPESCANGLVLLIPLLLVVGIGGNHGKTPKSSYPVTLDVDYPERLNRLTTAFRIILILPILGILLLIQRSSLEWLASASSSGYVFICCRWHHLPAYAPHDLVQVEVSQMVV